MKMNIVVIILMSSFCAHSIAQPGKYGKTEHDSIRCVSSLSYYGEFFKMKNYQDAVVHWRWCFNNCPKSSKKLYSRGAKMFQCFAENEQDKQKRENYIDTLMMIYDQRIEHFDQEGFVLGLKGVDILHFREENVGEAYEVLGTSIKTQGNKSVANVLTSYYLASTLLAEDKKLTSKKLNEDFNEVNAIINYQLDKLTVERKRQYYSEAKSSIEGLSNHTIQANAMTRPGGCVSDRAGRQAKYEKTGEEVVIETPSSDDAAESDEIYMIVENMPKFGSGDAALIEYITSTIRYPAMAKEQGISGIVYVSFVVDKNGDVQKAKIIRGIGGGCDKEALRVVNAMPRWTPGTQRGKLVNVQYNLPIRITIPK